MKNLLKICLTLVLCLSLIMMFGCSKEEAKKTDKNNDPTVTTPSDKVEVDPNGELDTDAGPDDELEGEDSVDQTENPEGDPGFQDQPVENDEPVINVDEPVEEGGKETEPDMEVDFGDLMG